jgi:hypothetical protein
MVVLQCCEYYVNRVVAKMKSGFPFGAWGAGWMAAKLGSVRGALKENDSDTIFSEALAG